MWEEGSSYLPAQQSGACVPNSRRVLDHDGNKTSPNFFCPSIRFSPGQRPFRPIAPAPLLPRLFRYERESCSIFHNPSPVARAESKRRAVLTICALRRQPSHFRLLFCRGWESWQRAIFRNARSNISDSLPPQLLAPWQGIDLIEPDRRVAQPRHWVPGIRSAGQDPAAGTRV